MWQYTGKQRPSFAIEPGEAQESVWDYPRPPVIASDVREVIVSLGGTVIARSTNAVRVLETASPPTFYLPPVDIRFELLRKTSGSSFCEWKGNATYWSLIVGTQQVKNVGWSYETPSERFKSIRGFLSFYPSKLECTVDQEVVRPQSGGFYGGWVTEEIIGPCKGEPGTSGW